MKNYSKILNNTMTYWKRISKEKIAKLTEDIEKLRFEMSNLKSDDEDYDILIEICEQQLKALEHEKIR